LARDREEDPRVVQSIAVAPLAMTQKCIGGSRFCRSLKSKRSGIVALDGSVAWTRRQHGRNR
jgi:hypothetical protein